MAYNYDYGGDVMSQRPGASRRNRGMSGRNQAFHPPLPPKRPSGDSMRHSVYNDNYSRGSNRPSGSISGSRQYAYKLDQIPNKLAEKNNPVLSFYKEKNNQRLNSAARNNDSSHLKENIENLPWQHCMVFGIRL